MAKLAKKLDEQRRELPDAPGVYLFRDAAGGALYVGKARSIRKRVSSHLSGRGGGRGSGIGATAELTDRIDSIEVLVTQTEAEALLAEQVFIKRHRPRFNIRLRDDKSYPYVGVSLDEEYPRVYFTREKHRSGRAYFGPFSSAKRVRETLDLLGKLFQYRTCEGPEPGRRSGAPCLDYYIKRCQAPCVGYIDREEYRRNIEAIAGVLSGRYRDVERDLERKMTEAAAAEEFLAQYYSAAPSVPRLIVVGEALRDRAALLAEALTAQRGGAVEVRAAERGDKRRLRELAERNAKLALAQDRLRRERRRAQRVDALASLQAALDMDHLPVRIEGFDVSNLGPEHTVASMVVFEGGAPKKSDYRRFNIRGIEGASDDFASMDE